MTHVQIVRRQNGTLAGLFDPRANGLNLVRLALAVTVIIWHSFPLSGNSISFAPMRQFLENVSVDGFFAISGFLIVSSWMRHPRPIPYVRARALRIFPAFWVCLGVTALVAAPLGTLFVTGIWPGWSLESVTYILKNSALWIFQLGIDGTPANVAFPGVWNGSLWTLWWEFMCYLAVLVLGVLGLLHRKSAIPLLFGLATAGVLLTAYGPFHNFYLTHGVRFGVMFLAGALVLRLASVLPLSWLSVGASFAVFLFSLAMQDYRLVGAFPLAYSMIGAGALLKSPWARMRNDFSYGTYIYAFPVQQVMASAGVASFGVPIFAALSFALTAPLAILSWFLIERNALRLKWKKGRLGTSDTDSGVAFASQNH